MDIISPIIKTRARTFRINRWNAIVDMFTADQRLLVSKFEILDIKVEAIVTPNTNNHSKLDLRCQPNKAFDALKVVTTFTLNDKRIRLVSRQSCTGLDNFTFHTSFDGLSPHDQDTPLNINIEFSRMLFAQPTFKTSSLYDAVSSSAPDITINVGQLSYQLRKVVMSRSPFFSAMFKHSQGPYTLKEIDNFTFEQVVAALHNENYSRDQLQIIHDHSEDLFKASHRFQLEDLRIAAEDEIESQLSIENVADVTILASRYGSHILLEACARKLYTELTPSELETALDAISQHDRNTIDSLSHFYQVNHV